MLNHCTPDFLTYSVAVSKAGVTRLAPGVNRLAPERGSRLSGVFGRRPAFNDKLSGAVENRNCARRGVSTRVSDIVG